jgi:hypothetical protein
MATVEVRELIIKATITQDSNAGGESGSSSGAGAGNQEVIKACVEKVMEIIKEKNGR